MAGRLRSDRALRAKLSSPGRPGVARRERRRQFWALIADGLSSEDAAMVVGVSQPVGFRWFRVAGGMAPSHLSRSSKPLSGRFLVFAEREEIALLRAQGLGVREVARRLGRSPSTVSRELRRNAATRGGTRRCLQRGAFGSTAALEAAIQAYIDQTNAERKPFRWTKTADDILASVGHLCQRTCNCGGTVSHKTVRQWGLKFGQGIANQTRRRLPRAGDKWHLDEVAVRITGVQHWLWRAMVQDGCVLDILIQSRRNKGPPSACSGSFQNVSAGRRGS